MVDVEHDQHIQNTHQKLDTKKSPALEGTLAIITKSCPSTNSSALDPYNLKKSFKTLRKLIKVKGKIILEYLEKYKLLNGIQ